MEGSIGLRPIPEDNVPKNFFFKSCSFKQKKREGNCNSPPPLSGTMSSNTENFSNPLASNKIQENGMFAPPLSRDNVQSTNSSSFTSGTFSSKSWRDLCLYSLLDCILELPQNRQDMFVAEWSKHIKPIFEFLSEFPLAWRKETPTVSRLDVFRASILPRKVLHCWNRQVTKRNRQADTEGNRAGLPTVIRDDKDRCPSL